MPCERRTQLLVFLALRRGWVGRAELAALLWPDQQPKLAFTNLRKALFRLQSSPWADPLEAESGALRLQVDTDVGAFETALAEGRIGDAMGFRKGTLLSGFDDPSNDSWAVWLGFERERLNTLWRNSAQQHLTAGADAAETAALASHLLEDDPLDEAALRALMSSLASSGQGRRARQAYQAYALRLQQELGLAPSGDLKALHDSLSLVSTRIESIKSSGTAGRDDGFIGRTVELRRISALLGQDDCRLLCVTGPGGVGKTRIAQRAALELAPQFRDGAVFVPLDDLVAAGQLGGRLMRELGVPPAGRADALEQVIDFMRDRQQLLVLDNFEQLASEASVVSPLLSACPGTKLMVTSRIRLGLAGEWLLPLEGLPTPEEEDEDRAEAFDSVRLFIRAAQRVSPSLSIAAETPGIVDICRQVEGLPLALELAASWTRVLSCAEIAAELRESTELLRATDATQPARHASIEVVFDQSWSLLTEGERSVLARLSVFRGGFTPEAARAVSGAALPVLGALTDKSLLRRDSRRLSMHPLVQQFAAARLARSTEALATRASHAGYFHRYLEQLRSAADIGEVAALKTIDVEFENFRAAWRFSMQHNAADGVRKSVPTFRQYCDHRGRFQEALAMLTEMQASPTANADVGLQALLLSSIAHLEYRLDRYGDAEATARRGLNLAEQMGNHDATLQCLKVLGACYLRLGRLADAKHFFAQALKQAPAALDPHSAAAVLDNMALVEKNAGRFQTALKLSLRALAEHRRLGSVAGEALCLNNLGALYLDRDDPASAAMYLREGLALCERHGLLNTRALTLTNLTGIAILSGDHDEAQALGKRALEVVESAGNRVLACWLKLQFARLALERGDVGSARSDLGASLAIAIAIGRPSLQIAGVTRFAEILAAQQETASARWVLGLAEHHPRIAGPELDEVRAQYRRLPESDDASAESPSIEFDDLLHRIVAETDVAYAPLIAEFRTSA